jgi:hypothetical protein
LKPPSFLTTTRAHARVRETGVEDGLEHLKTPEINSGLAEFEACDSNVTSNAEAFPDEPPIAPSRKHSERERRKALSEPVAETPPRLYRPRASSRRPPAPRGVRGSEPENALGFRRPRGWAILPDLGPSLCMPGQMPFGHGRSIYRATGRSIGCAPGRGHTGKRGGTMLHENSSAEKEMALQDEVCRPTSGKSSAARVRAFRERRRAGGKRSITVYLSSEEFEKLQELARHRGWTQSILIGACVRYAWNQVLGPKMKTGG